MKSKTRSTARTNRGLFTALAFVALLTAVPALAAPLLTGGTETDTGLGYASGSTSGYDFTSLTNQSLTALGIWDQGSNGLSASYDVGLWLTSTQLLLASATLSSVDPLDTSLTVEGGQWRYETLLAPVALVSGTTYTLGFYRTTSLTPMDSLFVSYPTLTGAATVSVPNTARFASGGSLAFPTGTITQDRFHAQVNAQLVPEPGSAGLLALGALGLLSARRRKA